MATWNSFSYIFTHVPGLSTLSRIVAQTPPSSLCCLRPSSHHPSSLTSVSLALVHPIYLNWLCIFKYSVYLYPIAITPRQTVNSVDIWSLGSASNNLEEKKLQKTNKGKSIRAHYNENRLILKPPLRIEEVIKQFNSLKNNIEVVNLSAAEIDQMLSSDKDTKDSNEIR